ncbi:SDR family oxidoreductase (plasmid) [Paroceanicella profunda]|uniref:SDR family oxidoreductase n=1 Tax=Paroceanicella profunda TaxID=2579971 RepID=A0A5B8G3V3_9RHOB|nr:SDR family oxidoreductase [Paroceanicella profunda]QDL93982.1 SDR family oxidoreductase [Paroceanicella profunda]
MTADLSDRVIAISGGTSGIGLAIAAAAAAAGATVALLGRDLDRGAEAAASLPGALFVPCDVARREECQAAVAAVEAAFGRLDGVVASAGFNRRKLPQDLAEEDWDAVLDANLKGTFLLCQAAFPLLSRRGGKVVTIGSMLSIFGSPVMPAYAASKGGVVQLTRSLATAWAAQGIQVNCLLPGWIDTPLTVAARREIANLEADVLARTPAGRWGRPEDLAGPALFLLSEASDFVTGTALPVDGGYSVRA